jgi:hypothetical protein
MTSIWRLSKPAGSPQRRAQACAAIAAAPSRACVRVSAPEGAAAARVTA